MSGPVVRRRGAWAGAWCVVAVLAAPAASRAEDAPAPSAAAPNAAPSAAAPNGGTPGAAPATDARAPDEKPLGFEPEELPGAGGAAEGLSSAWAMMVKAVAGLAAVLMVIYLFLGKGLEKLTARQGAGRAMRVVDRVGLDAKKTLYLVDVDGVRTLVGVSETAMSMMVLPEPPPANGAPAAPSTGAGDAGRGDA